MRSSLATLLATTAFGVAGHAADAITVNQQNVANTLTNFFNTTGSIPAAFAALSPAALTTASGELGTGIIQSAINADGQFLNLMLDPTVVGRSGGFTKAGQRRAFRRERRCGRLCHRCARPTRASARPMRWRPRRRCCPRSRSTAGASGRPAMAARPESAAMPLVGSQDLTARVWGGAAGADYRISLDTLVGFALGGGGLNYSLANAMGAGSADLFQAGVYGRHNFGVAYIVGRVGLWLARCHYQPHRGARPASTSSRAASRPTPSRPASKAAIASQRP